MTREEFEKVFCAECGSQRCFGFGSEMAAGCKHYKELILKETDNTIESSYDDVEESLARIRYVLEKYNL